MVGMGAYVRFIRNLMSDRRATSSIEYGFICSLIVIAIIVSLNTFAGKVVNLMFTVSNAVVKAG